MALGISKSLKRDSWRQSRLRGTARHRGRHRIDRTWVRQQSLVGRSEMISPRTASGRLLMRSTQDSTSSWDLVGAGSPLLPALPGAGSITGVTAGGSLIVLELGSADSIFLEGVASRSRI